MVRFMIVLLWIMGSMKGCFCLPALWLIGACRAFFTLPPYLKMILIISVGSGHHAPSALREEWTGMPVLTMEKVKCVMSCLLWLLWMVIL